MGANEVIIGKLSDVVIKKSTIVTNYDIVDTNKIILVRNFGGFDSLLSNEDASEIILEWGDAVGGFELVRAGGDGTFNFNLEENFTGDNTKHLRIRRVNNGNKNKPLYAWLDAIIK